MPVHKMWLTSLCWAAIGVFCVVGLVPEGHSLVICFGGDGHARIEVAHSEEGNAHCTENLAVPCPADSVCGGVGHPECGQCTDYALPMMGVAAVVIPPVQSSRDTEGPAIALSPQYELLCSSPIRSRVPALVYSPRLSCMASVVLLI